MRGPASVARISRNALVSLILLLIVVLLAAEVALLINQRRFVFDEVRQEMHSQIRLLGEVSVEAILRSDYESVRRVLENWASEHRDTMNLRAEFPNGYVLMDYRRDPKKSGEFDMVHNVQFNGQELLRLSLRVDRTELSNRVMGTLIRYSIGVTATVLLVGIAIWLVLRRTAILPYEQEIDRHERTERELKRRTRELEALNEELNSFCYSVSHDLRAPLRAIDGFGHILREEYGTRLDDEGRQYIERSRAAARRIGDVIDDLLRLTALGRGPVQRERIDLSAMAREVCAAFAAHHPDRIVDVKIADGLAAEGDAGLLRIALENLLGNAWKYTSKTAEPQIEFGAERKGEEIVYFVRDNGAGFDAEYAHKLFQPFQRLHGTQDFAGTGIGLATVARIIQRHGGRTWAKGAVGQGATFYFTLSAVEQISGKVPDAGSAG